MTACLFAGALASACAKPAEDGARPAAPGVKAAAVPAVSSPLPALNYNRDVRPILSDKCFQCHGPDDKKRYSGLRLDQFAAATRPNAKSGHIPVVPGKPDASEAWRRITTHDHDETMPPVKSGKSLTDEQKETLKRWIAQGAKYETHWAFAPILAQKVPETRDKAWARNEVDAFILARLEQEGIAPSPEAGKAQLLRRVTLDLTGLPPTPEETAAFAADPSPDAYEKQVDRLLASPRHGEHMAMGWMDIARYSDTDGFQYDRTRTMWPWRDWVAEACNKDLPYSDFIAWQICGDLMPNATPGQIVASGFNRNHMLNNEGGRDAKENRADYVVDRTVVFGTAFLGLTLDCCRCHDHKFDPVTTRDFYSLSAFFNQTNENGGLKSWGPQYAYDTGKYGKQKVLVMGDLPREKWNKTHILNRGEWDQHGAEVEAGVPAALDSRVGGGPDPQPDARPGSHPAAKSEPNPAATVSAPVVAPPSKQKDRRELARWLVAPENPLLTRVEANRQWQRFFGFGLSRTPDDFGLQGEYPSHPELLDFLARKLRTENSLKQLQRLIVTSATYRQASAVRPDPAQRDPQNRLLARQARFRLPAAVLRDQALHVSGRLVEQVGGPPFVAPQPPGMWEEVTSNAIPFRADAGPAVRRRSLYMFWRRLSAPASLFDISNRQTCKVRVSMTNTPLQALSMLNDPVFVQAARDLASKAMREAGPTSGERLAFALERALCRKVGRDELAPFLACHDRLATHYRAHPDDAATFCRPAPPPPLPKARLGPGVEPTKPASWPAFTAPAAAEPPDPSDTAEWAAMAGVCSAILNLDETLTRE